MAQKRSCQQQRLSSETEDQRAARLLQLRNCQQQRLSSETTEEREDRLQCDADLHQRIKSVDTVVPLLDQPSVLKKIKFHTDYVVLKPRSLACKSTSQAGYS